LPTTKGEEVRGAFPPGNDSKVRTPSQCLAAIVKESGFWRNFKRVCPSERVKEKRACMEIPH
jgi:hypothetical protein